MRTLNGSDLHDFLSKLGGCLRKPTQITLMGSSVCMLKAQPGRFTEDIDIWTPTSNFDREDLKQAVAASGLFLDTLEHPAPDGEPYVQLVTPGVAEMGDFKPEVLFNYGNLTVLVPPTAFVIASKLRLVIEDPKHEKDISFLINVDNVSDKDILEAINTFKSPDNEMASENMILFFSDSKGMEP